MMKCHCFDDHILLHSNELQSSFGKDLTKVDTAPMFELMRCDHCGQLWRFDRLKNKKEYIASKLDSELGWQTNTTTIMIKARILEDRGGVSVHFCLWGECANFRVKGFEYCIDHLCYC